MAILYLITSPSGKQYVGISNQSFEKRWDNHLKKSSNCTLLKRAIKKYGQDNLQKKVLIEIDNYFTDIYPELLEQYETYFIKFFNTFAPNGYNCTSGGETCKKLCDETKEKIGMACRNYALNCPSYNGSIHKDEKTGKFRASKQRDGLKIYLGTYDTKEMAREAIGKFTLLGEINPDIKRKTDYNEDKFIHKRDDGGYVIQIKEDNLQIYLGVKYNIEEARTVRDEYFMNGVIKEKRLKRKGGSIKTNSKGEYVPIYQKEGKKYKVGIFTTRDEAERALQEALDDYTKAHSNP